MNMALRLTLEYSLKADDKYCLKHITGLFELIPIGHTEFALRGIIMHPYVAIIREIY